MEKTRKVSIIVPVYNIEKYIVECIESILNQTYRNIELILIDDGSTDKSGVICDEYKNKDGRVVVIHQENKGVSTARNRGLDEATGKYIMFADSDDFLETYAIELMVKSIRNCDMTICGYIEKFANKNIKHNIIESETIIGNKKAIELLFDRKYYGGYLWNKIFIADRIKENGLKFDTKIHMCEDLVFVCKYLLTATKVNLIPQELYYYRMRKSSMVWNAKSDKFKSLFDAYDVIYKLLENNKEILNDNLKYMCITDIFRHEKKLYNIDLKKYDYKKQYYYLLLHSSIDFKRKIKLIIMRRFKFIYDLFILTKIKKLQQFE